MLRPCAVAVALSVLALVPFEARAAGYQIESRTEAQLSSMRAFRDTSPDSPVLLPRRRLVQYLGFSAYELITGQPIGFETSMRVFADFGLPRAEAARVDGLRSEDAELLFANVSYRSDRFAAKLGRQTYTDLMDIMAFDGAYFRYVHAIGLGAEAYTGLWVKGSSVLASGVYQPDGIRESDLRRVGQEVAPAYAALDDIEPLVGVKLLVDNIKGISGSFGFRQSWLSGKTDIQRLAWEARYGRGRGLNVVSGLEYDLVMPRISNARLQARLDFAEFAASAEIMHVTPTLSADSIFLYFALAARDEGRVRVDYTPSGPFRFYASGVGSIYGTNIRKNATSLQLALASPDAPGSLNAGLSAGTAFKIPGFRAAADVTFREGFGGRQIWVDLTGGWVPEDLGVTVDARLSYAYVRDGFNALLRGHFIGAQVWGSYLLSKNARASVVVEQNFNAFSRSDTRMFVLLDWKVVL